MCGVKGVCTCLETFDATFIRQAVLRMCGVKGISELWQTRRSTQAMEEQQQPKSPIPPQILHQRQRLQLCLLHALNNLFQGETTFTRSELNSMASSLSGDVQRGFGGPFSRLFNSHYNIVTGNYDANVLMQALQMRGAEAAWFDRRKGAVALNFNDADKQLIGIILNHPTERFSGIWKGRHWSALRKIGGVWYDLDSDLAAPVPIGKGDEEVKQFIDQCFAGGSEAFLVSKCGGIK